MSDHLKDTNFLELLTQQEKAARYLQLLKEVKDAIKRREINNKQLMIFFRECILQMKSYCLTSNNPGIVESFSKETDGLWNTEVKRKKNFSLNI